MRMVRLSVILFALLLIALPAAAQAPDLRAAIEAGMRDSAAGWNAGDVDRFLAIYSDDPATSFTGNKGVEHGKAAIRARYLANYAKQFGPASAATRSRLSFTFVDLRPLGVDHALLIARWRLDSPGQEKPAEGMTSLVFRREGAGWHIIADHSS